MGDNTTMVIAAVGVACICCVLSSSVMFVMGGDDDAKKAADGGGTGSGTGSGTGGGEDDEYTPVTDESVTCKTNAPGGKGSDAVFRAAVDEPDDFYLLRHYPTDAIAASWDPNWKSAKEIKDCTKYEAGVDMKMKHPLVGIAPNLSVSCKKNNMDGRDPDTIYRIRKGTRFPPRDAILRVHPDPPAAADVQIEDCTGVHILG